LTVWICEDPAGAQEALNKLIELSKQHLVQIDGAAVVSRAEARKSQKPTTMAAWPDRRRSP